MGGGTFKKIVAGRAVPAAPVPAELAVGQNAVTATETLRSGPIDALVHELYGLTSEEIQLVEDSSGASPRHPFGTSIKFSCNSPS